MMQNLRYYCRQRIEALADKQVRFEDIIVQGANKISYDSLSNLEVTEIKEFHIKEPMYIFFYNMKEIFVFCESVKLKVYKLKIL